MNTQEDLYLEYARVITMCREYNEKHNTNVMPWECVKQVGIGFDDHPAFEVSYKSYTFAIAILEGKPVFVGDKVCHKTSGIERTVEGDYLVKDFHDKFTWTPPQKKRTFELNGVELPCPNSIRDRDQFCFILDGWAYYFDDEESRNEVTNAIHHILEQARDKE